jgi:hypothetical protein
MSAVKRARFGVKEPCATGATRAGEPDTFVITD